MVFLSFHIFHLKPTTGNFASELFSPCPRNLSARIWEVSRDRRLGRLLLEELRDPLHLAAERVDHPDVLLGQDADRHHLAEPLESGQVLEGVRSVPHSVVGGL